MVSGNFKSKVPDHEVIELAQKFSTSHVTSSVEEILAAYKTSVIGLTRQEAHKRLKIYGHNEVEKKKKHIIIKFLEKFANPLVFLLLLIAVISYYTGETKSTIIVSLMALISAVLSFFQEYKAEKEVKKLFEMVKNTAAVYRDKQLIEIPIRDIVPGDIVYLSAGDIIPADIRILSGKDFFVNQSAITGESFPVEKVPHPQTTKSSSESVYSNIAFQGSTVVSGSALGLVILTGARTQFGTLTKKVSEQDHKSQFEQGINSFTYLLIRVMIVLVVFIFSVNVFLKGESFAAALAYSLAVAVGLTPEMLPMILSVNLAKGAYEMSKKKVIVKKLASMQNLGSIDILCTDKTGTLTRGEVVLEKYLDLEGKDNEDVLYYGYINSFYQTGLKNLIDKAILKHDEVYVENIKKVDEIPYDFARRMMSVVVEINGKHVLVTKGAPEEILKRCAYYELKHRVLPIREEFYQIYTSLSDKARSEGFRVLAVAYREFSEPKHAYTKEDEKELVLMGFMWFLDPPKPSCKLIIKELKKLGISLKILTGDNDIVTLHICKKVGIKVTGVLNGDEIDKMTDEELAQKVETCNVFSRLTPLQKERVILLLKKNGHVVGYMGDGINDAPALKASDVGISVNNAVEIAKETADVILLKKSLNVLRDGIIEGRKVFGNILKYIRMGSSSNFGNMFSQTGASIFVPFFPMTPVQLLLNNFLYDLSQVAIPTDSVDDDFVKKPLPWNIKGIQKFMFIFGPISSLFDFLTFGIMLYLKAPAQLFQTMWFIVSLLTQTLVIHVIRTQKIPFVQSSPSKYLLIASIIISLIGITLVMTPLGSFFGFVILDPWFVVLAILIVLAYLITVQMFKDMYVRNFGYS
ncbi:MAG: magnesium-translocating P-type ATPase [Candidatus Micrarchaeota archaeon]|nr:magnesium-translocating P-type ATPase [Candidatus Micrarchaeota archaeon]